MKFVIKAILIFIAIPAIWLKCEERLFFGPHVTSTTPWVTKIIVFNSGNVDEDFSLTLWDLNGELTNQTNHTIPAMDSIKFVVTRETQYQLSDDEILLEPVDGTFSVQTQSRSVAPLLSFQFGESQSISQFFLSDTTGYQYMLPNMSESHFSWTGLAIMNSNDEFLELTLDAYKEGALVASRNLEITANSKYVAVSDAIWAGLGLDDFDRIIVSSDQAFPAPVLITGNSNQDRHVFFMGVVTRTTPPEVTVSSSYTIVDTNQATTYNQSSEISPPSEGEPFSGQDATYSGNQPLYADNGDGTITDLVTGLMWQKDPGQKITYNEAVAQLDGFSLAGYNDWRLPSIKELYSLILFSGQDPGVNTTDTANLKPFIDTDYFMFEYGDSGVGERIIDSQYATSTLYTSTTMNGNETVFGVNFADGRIKGYPVESAQGGADKKYFIMYVRGSTGYGVNDFQDNGDDTVTDNATGLMWMKIDSGEIGGGDQSDGAMNWEQALAWSQGLEHADYDDWRLPNIKELQSIVNYNLSPDASGTAAIDPIFQATEITNEAGQADYPFYWSSTTHVNSSPSPASGAAYICFGRAMGYMGSWLDVHGAGAQRSDPKSGDPSAFPNGRGPQGDAIHIYNYVRCVRDVE